MRHWREEQFSRGLVPPAARHGLAAWGFLARRPRLYRLATRAAMTRPRACSAARGRFRRLPLAGGWTRGRDLPAPQGPTFMAQWAKARGKRAA